MDLHVTIDAQVNLSEQIYQQIHDAVLGGVLRTGEALRPTRELAQRLGVSRNTVTSAYDRLVAEGYLTTRRGAGTFVRGLSVAEREGGCGLGRVRGRRRTAAASAGVGRTPGTDGPLGEAEVRLPGRRA
jgi:GntR family transcriptional regulator/MocR family aminotransferase